MAIRTQRLHDRARECRDLAATAVTEEARTILLELAQRYEREASIAEAGRDSPELAETAA
jgi:hypothetical protein